jgi:hypothetical protein
MFKIIHCNYNNITLFEDCYLEVGIALKRVIGEACNMAAQLLELSLWSRHFYGSLIVCNSIHKVKRFCERFSTQYANRTQ